MGCRVLLSVHMNPDSEPSAPGASGIVSGRSASVRLTRRERELVELLAWTGASNPQLAQHLSLSRSSVKNRMSRLFSKTGTRSRAELVAYAWTHGLVE